VAGPGKTCVNQYNVCELTRRPVLADVCGTLYRVSPHVRRPCRKGRGRGPPAQSAGWSPSLGGGRAAPLDEGLGGGDPRRLDGLGLLEGLQHAQGPLELALRTGGGADRRLADQAPDEGVQVRGPAEDHLPALALDEDSLLPVLFGERPRVGSDELDRRVAGGVHLQGVLRDRRVLNLSAVGTDVGNGEHAPPLSAASPVNRRGGRFPVVRARAGPGRAGPGRAGPPGRRAGPRPRAAPRPAPAPPRAAPRPRARAPPRRRPAAGRAAPRQVPHTEYSGTSRRGGEGMGTMGRGMGDPHPGPLFSFKRAIFSAWKRHIY